MGDQTDPGTTEATTSAAPLERSLATVVTGVRQMVSAVQSGDLVIDPATGQQLINAIGDHIDKVGTWQRTAGDLATPMPLGQNWVGQGMSDKFAGRAGGTDNSLSNVLDQYHAVLTDAHHAVSQSMANYRSTDHDIRGEVRKLDHGEKGARLS
ncbi:MAG TPA: hypothetical protein VG756_12860 [Pseudonocardiaceae bacterium]|jgi:hypothetical protein|nr:hypothetical protein [Pseudonocardiaceae bacterium]